MEVPCPICGSTDNPKFDNTSAWCAECVHGELADQRRQDTHQMSPQVFHA